MVGSLESTNCSEHVRALRTHQDFLEILHSRGVLNQQTQQITMIKEMNGIIDTQIFGMIQVGVLQQNVLWVIFQCSSMCILIAMSMLTLYTYLKYAGPKSHWGKYASDLTISYVKDLEEFPGVTQDHVHQMVPNNLN